MDEPVPLQEAAASAPTAPHIEREPIEWQPRVLWVGGRQLAGAASFFFLSFVFGYFYLRSLDLAKKWKIGHVSPPIGFGVAIIVVLILSAVLLRLASMRAERSVELAFGAVLLALAAIILQCIEYTQLKFGPASGGYASIFVGWTSLYTVFALLSVYWMETQVASLWRKRREGAAWAAEENVTVEAETATMAAGLESCSFFWSYYVFIIGLAAFVILYLI